MLYSLNGKINNVIYIFCIPFPETLLAIRKCFCISDIRMQVYMFILNFLRPGLHFAGVSVFLINLSNFEYFLYIFVDADQIGLGNFFVVGQLGLDLAERRFASLLKHEVDLQLFQSLFLSVPPSLNSLFGSLLGFLMVKSILI